MDVRGKLVELLCSVQDYGTKNTCEEWFVTVECKDNETVVDHLIANGVTVQEMDVVEVVRCKDCVYFRPAEDWNGKKYNACYLKPNVCIFEKKMEDFCSCGERRLPQPPKGE